jgi:ribonuclease HI
MGGPEDRIVVYTDGACSGNPGPGGWAWAVAPDGTQWGSGGVAHTTNQRMEILAAFEAVKTLEGPVTVVSDSTYVVNCFRDRWWEGWLRRGWRNSQRQPVANRDLWEPFIELVRSRGDIEFRWVKGHSGDRMNDLVDQLAVAAARGPSERIGDPSADKSPTMPGPVPVPVPVPGPVPVPVPTSGPSTDEHRSAEGNGTLF